MDLELSYRRYQLEIPQTIWLEFFAQLTDENQGRPLTLKQRDRQIGDIELLRHKPLCSIDYTRPDHGNDLVITVSQAWGSQAATFAHRIVSPKIVNIITDEDGGILTCTVTDSDQTQTIINFQARGAEFDIG